MKFEEEFKKVEEHERTHSKYVEWLDRVGEKNDEYFEVAQGIMPVLFKF